LTRAVGCIDITFVDLLSTECAWTPTAGGITLYPKLYAKLEELLLGPAIDEACDVLVCEGLGTLVIHTAEVGDLPVVDGYCQIFFRTAAAKLVVASKSQHQISWHL
jgi:hypothetical protein